MRTVGDYSPSRAARLDRSTGPLDLSGIKFLIGETILEALDRQVVSLDCAEVLTRNRRNVSEDLAIEVEKYIQSHTSFGRQHRKHNTPARRRRSIGERDRGGRCRRSKNMGFRRGTD